MGRNLPALSGAFDALAEGTVDDQSAVGEVNIFPTEREQFAQAQPRVRGDPVHLCVLVVIGPAGGLFGYVEVVFAGAPVGASLRSLGKGLYLFGLLEVEDGRRRLAPLASPRGRICRESVGVLAHAVAVDRAHDRLCLFTVRG
jgi:hypothetical protein